MNFRILFFVSVSLTLPLIAMENNATQGGSVDLAGENGSYQHEGLFENKVVIVTGAASGIGRACARRFAEEGAKVCIADIDVKGAEDVVQSIIKANGEAFALRVDVSKEEDNECMLEETIKRFGRVDVVVLNAGIVSAQAGLLESTIADFDRIMSVNLRGCYLGLKSAGKFLKPESSIVAISSVAGLLGFSYSPAYAASKHGVIGLVRSCTESFASRGIRVNAVCPGITETKMMGYYGSVQEEPVLPPSKLKMLPYKGKASAQHIAEFVLFLASSRASFATGGVHVVDGGLTSMISGSKL